ncbi:MAG: protein kinase domain-containing protein [Anaerolineae bacterium]
MQEQTILRERYRLERLLGRGGMADVYLAFDLRRQVHVAVKVLREDLAEDPDFVRRFQREAEALARLDHPYIVRFYSFERQGPLAFIVMDYVPGTTLRGRLLEAGGPLPLPEVTQVVRQVGAALQYAHNEGFIHRDIKPGNVMLRKDGTALLSDFGIARVADAATMTLGPLGTPAYMSPEQILGREADPRTDVYCLGIVMYEMVTGRRPFTGEVGSGTSVTERVRDEHLHAQPPDPRRFNSTLPAVAAGVIMRALAKEPGARWPDATSLVRAWEEALQIGQQVPGVACVTVPPPPPTPPLAQVPARTPPAQAPVRVQTARPADAKPTPAAVVPPIRETASAQPTTVASRRASWLVWAIPVASVVLLACAAVLLYQLMNSNSASREATVVAQAQQTADARGAETAIALAAEWATATAAAQAGQSEPTTVVATELPTVTPGTDTATATAQAEAASREAELVAKSTVEMETKLTSEALAIQQATATAEAQVIAAAKATAEAQATADAQATAEAQATADAAAKATAEAQAAADAAAKATAAAEATANAVPPKPGIVLDFERNLTWRQGDELYGELAHSGEQVHSGASAGKWSYNIPATERNYDVFMPRPAIALPGKPGGLSAWVYGNGSGHFLNAWIQDSAGEVRQYTFGQVSHQGWAQMLAPFDEGRGWPNTHISGPDNGTLDYPVSLFALVLDAIDPAQTSTGTIYIDDVATVQ